MSLKVAIVSPNYLFGESLKTLIEGELDLDIIGIFYGGPLLKETLQDIIKKADIIIATCSSEFNILHYLPEDFYRRTSDQLKVLCIGERSFLFSMERNIQELLINGTIGILPPSADSNLLKKALRAIISGEVWLDRSTLLNLLHSIREVEKGPRLAKREREIINHICQGYRNKEIAQKLNISEQTVKSHCSRIYKKLGVTDRLHLALSPHRERQF
jgi:DNA-binding NarL/FixJ family response regulator